MREVREHRKPRRSRLNAAAITLIAAALAAGWSGHDRSVAEAAGVGLHASAAPAAPAASTATAARVAPETERLAAELAEMIRVPGWSNDAWGVLVVSLDHGDTLFDHRADQQLVPASNLKLYTSAGALHYLGPDYRYGTYLATRAALEAGVLQGDLHVYGTGDPTLSSRFQESSLSVWEAFADTLTALGVREIHGDVVGDGSYFEGSSTGIGWQTSYINAWYAAPAGALSFNDNLVTLRVRPASRAGWRPEIQLVPGGAGVAIVNLATTVDGAGGRIEVTRAAYDGPIVIRGEIGRGAGDVWHGVPVPDPARYSAAVLREVLEQRGIRVSGVVRSVHDAAQSIFSDRRVFAPGFDEGASPRVLAMHRSPPLLEILKIVNKRSHNLYAEQVLRTVGRTVVGSGSIEGGARAIRLMIEGETGAEPSLTMSDGSGLSVLDRASPRSIVELLSLMSRSPMFETYLSTLPMAGERGLRRMGGSAAQANLRAKTGTINNVSALSGYVTAANGERLAFSIISNQVPSTWRAKRVEDRIGARLASFSRPRPAADAATRAAAVDTTPAAGTGRSAPGVTPPATPAAPEAEAEPSATQSARVHVIRSGDTLDGIARAHGTTVAALREANPGLNPRRLIPGREVRLP